MHLHRTPWGDGGAVFGIKVIPVRSEVGSFLPPWSPLPFSCGPCTWHKGLSIVKLISMLYPWTCVTIANAILVNLCDHGQSKYFPPAFCKFKCFCYINRKWANTGPELIKGKWSNAIWRNLLCAYVQKINVLLYHALNNLLKLKRFLQVRIWHFTIDFRAIFNYFRITYVMLSSLICEELESNYIICSSYSGERE